MSDQAKEMRDSVWDRMAAAMQTQGLVSDEKQATLGQWLKDYAATAENGAGALVDAKLDSMRRLHRVHRGPDEVTDRLLDALAQADLLTRAPAAAELNSLVNDAVNKTLQPPASVKEPKSPWAPVTRHL